MVWILVSRPSWSTTIALVLRFEHLGYNFSCYNIFGFRGWVLDSSPSCCCSLWFYDLGVEFYSSCSTTFRFRVRTLSLYLSVAHTDFKIWAVDFSSSCFDIFVLRFGHWDLIFLALYPLVLHFKIKICFKRLILIWNF